MISEGSKVLAYIDFKHFNKIPSPRVGITIERLDLLLKYIINKDSIIL
jgi:hypothetical protein